MRLTVILLLVMAGCTQPSKINELALSNLKGESTQIDLAQNTITVIYFLSPECPLCINYTLAFKAISKQFVNDSVRFYGIHSGKWFSAKEVNGYKLKYDLDFDMLLDHGNLLAQALGASVTPEVFVLNSNSDILYSGKIDNWVNDLGKKKLKVSEHYLSEALASLIKGEAIETKKTEPVGCLIE
ncbi:MAG: redoxin domain-containing protein [Flavobacteriales bacterium]